MGNSHWEETEMGEAERRLRERAMPRPDPARVAQDQQKRRELVSEIRSLIPSAIAALRAADWPGGQLLRQKKAFGRWWEKAGWPLATQQGGYDSHSRSHITSLWLLSDGNLVSHSTALHKYHPLPLAELDGRGTETLQAVRDSLRKLAASEPELS